MSHSYSHFYLLWKTLLPVRWMNQANPSSDWRPPHLILLHETRSRDCVPCSFLFTRGRRKRYLHCCSDHSGCTCPLAYAHYTDARHKRKDDTASPNHMTYAPSSILATGCRLSAFIAHITGNLAWVFIGGHTVRSDYPLSHKDDHAMRQRWLPSCEHLAGKANLC